uniref:Uncharacterized protein n=1 Tax=Sphaerodactylus townsendi TaxID=933632 RepID=A0ACB8EWQ3_9SAUR
MKSTGVFITSSEATIPASQWNTFEPFFCKAKHPSETKVTRVVRQTPIVCLPPKVIVRVPPLEDFKGPYLNATLFCKASGLHTERTTITWMKSENVLTSGFTTTAAVREGRGSFSITSELIVTKKDWYANKVFSCQVQNEKFNEMRNVSMLTVCEGSDCTSAQIQVETIPPSFGDMYLNNTVTLTCRISNLPFGLGLDELNVTWIRERGSTPLNTSTGQPEDQENSELVFVDATATVCREEWENGDNYLCKVRHPQLASTKTKSLKKQKGGSRSPPSVYVLPPPAEQLALRETATVTCLLKDFYPNDIFVRWMRNNEPVGASEYYISQPIRESKSPERYFAYSTLNVKEQDWSYGATYTCVVGHEALPLQTTQKTVDKSTGKPTFVNVSLVLSDVASSCH